MRLSHRISYDTDIFLLDPQVLGHLTPETNDLVAGFAEEFVRSANGMKIVTGGGDIDFVVAPDVTADPPVAERIDGRVVATHTNAEILAKKIQYRGFKFTHRDVFDLAVLIDRERTSVDRALGSCGAREVDAAFDMCIERLPGLTADLPDYINPTRAGQRYMREASPLVADFIATYRKRKSAR
ncbi:MAG: hypothetical protein HY059_14145 [Proteobacteria bacterium]|nr:hypothetical protein [Pseudomonadota bacterium]